MFRQKSVDRQSKSNSGMRLENIGNSVRRLSRKQIHQKVESCVNHLDVSCRQQRQKERDRDTGARPRKDSWLSGRRLSIRRFLY